MGMYKYRFTATQRTATASGRNSVDADGRIKPTSDSANVTTFSFYGDIKERKGTGDYVQSGKRHFVRAIEITADSRSVARLNIDDTLTFDNNTDTWQVIDIFESVFTRKAQITAKLNR